MPRSQPIERLRVSPRSAVIAVAMLGATVMLLRLVVASQRVLGWILTAAVVAGLLHPLVSLFARKMPRGAAVAAVVLLTAGVGGIVGYGAVGGLVRETRKLQDAVPRRAAKIEESRHFGKSAREFKLEERSRRFMRELPARLRGGTPAEALRAA
ncbi:MAG: hypothetical protein H0W70_07130, partial [Actinobacteria bacterium]|nr:hypothetical protein [Actinomycetota bacterium]